MTRQDLFKLCAVPTLMAILSLILPITLCKLAPKHDSEALAKSAEIVQKLAAGTEPPASSQVIRLIEASTASISANEKLAASIADYATAAAFMVLILAIIQIGITIVIYKRKERT
jgi:hypothetical protein